MNDKIRIQMRDRPSEPGIHILDIHESDDSIRQRARFAYAEDNAKYIYTICRYCGLLEFRIGNENIEQIKVVRFCNNCCT